MLAHRNCPENRGQVVLSHLVGLLGLKLGVGVAIICCRCHRGTLPRLLTARRVRLETPSTEQSRSSA